MDTPPHTPTSEEPPSLDSLHVHYYDFAYEERGPFRLTSTDIAGTTAKSFADLLSGPTMNVYVGPKRRHWSLHRNLLNYHTTWFHDKVREGVREKGGFTPSSNNNNINKNGIQHNAIDFVDTDPRAFELLVKYLYQGHIDDVTTMSLDKKWDYADSCQQLYLLCSQINLPELKNEAIDQFRKGCFQAGLVPGPEEMRPIYERTGKEDAFRKLVSRIAARQIMDPFGECDAGKYRECFATSPDFGIDVVNAIKEGAVGKLFDDPTEGEGCLYHDHQFGQKCAKTGG